MARVSLILKCRWPFKLTISRLHSKSYLSEVLIQNASFYFMLCIYCCDFTNLHLILTSMCDTDIMATTDRLLRRGSTAQVSGSGGGVWRIPASFCVVTVCDRLHPLAYRVHRISIINSSTTGYAVNTIQKKQFPVNLKITITVVIIFH